jgi:hypothetical protein
MEAASNPYLAGILAEDAANVARSLFIEAYYPRHLALSGDAKVYIHQVSQRFPSCPEHTQILSMYRTSCKEFVGVSENLPLGERVVGASERRAEEDQAYCRVVDAWPALSLRVCVYEQLHVSVWYVIDRPIARTFRSTRPPKLCPIRISGRSWSS